MEYTRIKGRLAAWCACEKCGTERWVLIRRGKPQSRICKACRNDSNRNLPHPAGPDHPRWRGGRSVTVAGYVEVWLAPDHPLASMRNSDGYVYEHRLVMAQKLGRALLPAEEVHHKREPKSNNRVSNLVLLSKSDHAKEPHRELRELRNEVARLRKQLGIETDSS